MRRRQPYRRPIPTIWLMTDERADAGLEAALHRLPRGAGVVFRHYSLAPKERRARYERVRAITRHRKLVLVLAGPTREAIAWRADGAHNRGPYGPVTRPLLRTAPAHDGRALVRARLADLTFLSPVYPTRSHPGARVLGPVRSGLMMKRGSRSIALGGMNARRWQHLARLGARGWAAIDAWSSDSGQTACL